MSCLCAHFAGVCGVKGWVAWLEEVELACRGAGKKHYKHRDFGLGGDSFDGLSV